LDCLGIHAREVREHLVSIWTKSLGLHRHVPATLLLIQSADQQVDPPMAFLVRMSRFLLAGSTLTLVNF
jgi:hypothetical protein